MLELTPEELAAGERWWPEYAARLTRLGRRYGYDDRCTLAAFSALSRRLKVRANVHALYRCLVAHQAGLAPEDVSRSMPGKSASGVMLESIEAAFRALDGNVRDSIRRHKVRSFYLNLRGRDSEVTVDTWAALPFGYPPGAKFGVREYRAMRSAYRTAALLTGVSPATYQAATWIHLRGGEH